jgi:RNA polymerase sigma-32 factor
MNMSELQMHNHQETAATGGAKIAQAAGHVDGYATAINRYDLLERGQEQLLARRWREQRDRSAVDLLVTSHLRFAAKIARSYRGYGLPLADIVAEANLGLVIAASRFEPDHGARFSTYARWWIKATIHEHILRSWSLVKIGTTAAQRKLFFRLRREMQKLQGTAVGLTGESAKIVARRLKVTAREVVEMDCRLGGDVSLNALVNSDSGATEWADTLPDEAPDPETLVAEHDEMTRRAWALRAALNVLTPRERRVFEARRLADHPPTFDQLGREMLISSERVRQLESRAFAKVKRATWQHLGA